MRFSKDDITAIFSLVSLLFGRGKKLKVIDDLAEMMLAYDAIQGLRSRILVAANNTVSLDLTASEVTAINAILLKMDSLGAKIRR